MDPNLGQHKSSNSNADVKNWIRETRNREMPNKCSQCDFASSQASNLRIHLKTHSGEKSNKCNHCDFASSQASTLRTHLKTLMQAI